MDFATVDRLPGVKNCGLLPRQADIAVDMARLRLFDSHPSGGLRMSTSDNISADQLRLFIERIERLEEEKKGIADDIKDVYAEAKSTGFDSKTMRAIVRLRRMEKHDRQEAEALLETYKAALGLE
jgi:uncharacterized protein (UPF0335 family)